MKETELKKLLDSMTLEEKLCQMTQCEPLKADEEKSLGVNPDIKTKGLTEKQYYSVGSMIVYVPKAADLRRVQKEHLKRDPHKIPLLFMSDVLHGKETVFPIPLAMGCSFNTELLKECYEVSAEECAASGVHTVFAPAIDLSRDARWGRSMESFGEDPCLSSRMAGAAVTGFQGNGDTIDENHVSCCAKHYLGYGAVTGGRDYNCAEISDNELYNYYLPSFKAAVENNVSMIMTSFNTLNGVPMTVNEHANRQILRGDLGFDGVLISDYNSLGECENHGISSSSEKLAELGIKATLDIEMMNTLILNNGEKSVKGGAVDEEYIDSAVLRILRLKNKLGLFEDPFKGLSEEKEESFFNNLKSREKSREIAEQSAVLLKNSGVLPLKSFEKIWLCGPLSVSEEVGGEWAFSMQKPYNVSLFEGISNIIGKENIILSKTDKIYRIEDIDSKEKEDIPYPESADEFENCKTCIIAVGEHMGDTGEASSKTNIRLTKNQAELVKKVKQSGKKTVVIVFSGRPLDISDIEPYSDALIYAWYLGCESGNALARLIFGLSNPSGKLAMSLPRCVGQCPIYYNHLNTGRPYNKTNRFSCGYTDCENEPLFSFGFGLSYTEFRYEDISVNKNEIKIKVKNTGDFDGFETIQLYVSLKDTSVSQPVKALKDFKKIFLKSGEEKEITFKINKDMFSFYKNKVKTLEKCSAVLFLRAQSGEFIKISDFEVCL